MPGLLRSLNERFSKKQRILFVGALLVTGVVGGQAAFAADDPAMSLSNMDGVVVVSGKNFTSGATVSLTAKVSGGSAKTTEKADSKGHVAVGFSVPEGFTGKVTVTATDGDASVNKTINVSSSGESPATTMPATATTVPTDDDEAIGDEGDDATSGDEDATSTGDESDDDETSAGDESDEEEADEED